MGLNWGYLDQWLKRLWEISRFGRELQHLKVVPKHSDFEALVNGEVRTIFVDESIEAQWLLRTWQKRVFNDVSGTLIVILHEPAVEVGVWMIGLEIGYGKLVEVELCPGYLQNGICSIE
jgi:hypothetical protein